MCSLSHSSFVHSSAEKRCKQFFAGRTVGDFYMNKSVLLSLQTPHFQGFIPESLQIFGFLDKYFGYLCCIYVTIICSAFLPCFTFWHATAGSQFPILRKNLLILDLKKGKHQCLLISISSLAAQS